jgi:hypothetical protein
MSQRDNFAGGFVLGAIFGGVVGGVFGALLATGRLEEMIGSDTARLKAEPGDTKPGKAKKRLKSANGQADIEAARRGLEDKIAQLNDAIDDVRQKLGGVNGAPLSKEVDRTTVRDR